MALKKTRFIKGIILAPDDVAIESINGELKVDSADGYKIKAYLDGASREIITNSQSQVLTNKTLTSPVINTGVSGTAISLDGTLTANSDTLLSSQKAIKTYVDAQIGQKDQANEILTNPSISGTVGETVQVVLQEHEDRLDDLVTLSGVAANAENLGTFTGTTIPDNSTVKGALQSIETTYEYGISNIEVSNLKSGVLNTSTTLASASDLQVPSALAVKSYVDSSVTPDATTLIKGKIKLAGDLAGTADLPTVPSLSLKAPLASPTFTGIPKAPTATTGDDSTQIATTAFVTNAVLGAGGGGGGSSDYLIDEMISKTSTDTSALNLIYKRVREATSLTSFNSLMVNEGTPTSGNLTIDIKVGAVPYTLSARFNGTINSMAVQADGKVILVGAFTSYSAKSVGRNIIRLNTDGTVDPTFVVGTGFNVGSVVNVVKILSDGSVLVGGAFSSYNGATLRGLCKLSSLGILDTAFTSGTRGLLTGAGEIKDIQVRSSGKIILLGGFTTSGYPVTAKGLIQLNTDGSYDSSFEAGNLYTFSYTFFQGLLLSDDSLFLVGYVGEYDLLSGAAYSAPGIIKLTPSGTQDPTFTTPGAPSTNVNTIALHQGDIVLGGAFSTVAFGGGLSASRIVKLNSTTGAVIGPTTFSPPTGLTEILEIIVDTDDTIFLAPLSASMLKLNADGTSNATFTSTLATVKSFAFASNGNLLVGGAFTTNNTRILPSTGAFDITYDTMISIFDAPPSFNFASLANGDILNGTIVRDYIPAGYYVKVDITAVPATYIGSFYITLY
jgi:uncharacterized delta-60 repeat protein